MNSQHCQLSTNNGHTNISLHSSKHEFRVHGTCPGNGGPRPLAQPAFRSHSTLSPRDMPPTLYKLLLLFTSLGILVKPISHHALLFMCAGQSLALFSLCAWHSYLSGGYLPCRKDSKVSYFLKQG